MRKWLFAILVPLLVTGASTREAFRVPGDAGAALATLTIHVSEPGGGSPDSVEVRIEAVQGGFSRTFELELERGRRVVELRLDPGEYRVEVRTAHAMARPGGVRVEPGRDALAATLEFRLESMDDGAPPEMPPPPPVMAARANGGGKKDTLEIVRVFYATNRNATGRTDVSKAFGSEWRDSLSYGAAFVSIPRQHEMGRLERPSILRFEFRVNPRKHVVVQHVEPATADVFFGSVRAALGALEEPRGLIYIHGYNVGFEGALLRAGQMAYDLDLPIVPIAFSWPSLGKASGYAADEATVELAAERVRDFMLALRQETGLKHIDVITHSMGARAIGYALASIAGRGAPGDSLVGELILSAPDVDQRKMAGWIRDLRPLIRRVTIYGSSKDRALWLSGGLHNYPRAGDGGADVFVDPAVETIDATAVPTDFVSHTQPGDGSAVTSDAYYVMRHLPVSQRCCLRPGVKNGVTYWELVPRAR